MSSRITQWLIGAPRNLRDPRTYHTISLIAVLAWVGLGADGLSSCAYGPEEAFKALGAHSYLALPLAAATILTVLIISFSYSRLIEHFPYGGGGYVVATKLLGHRWGVVSGSALLVDYVLTISVSVASGADQLFSALPPEYGKYKLVFAGVMILLLVTLNLRGVKESVTILAPVFAIFLIAHGVLIFGGIGAHLLDVPIVVDRMQTEFQSGLKELGFFGMLAVFFRAYSMGAGTYTGIEAVSNGVSIMREPKVHTARRTMFYMAVSLAVTAGGILLLYLLYNVTPEEGKTMNAVLLDRFAGDFAPFDIPLGKAFILVALASAAALLFVAAQAGFVDGPRVMANMAIDSWLPHRFAQISNRLVMQNGVLLMGIASMVILVMTGGSVTALVTMYAINVFITFTLTQLGMCRFWVARARKQEKWKRSLSIHFLSLCLCASILTVMLVEKFSEGAVKTVIITGAVVGVAFWIRSHYLKVQENFHRLNLVMEALPAEPPLPPQPLDPKAPTAVLLVNDFSGMGIHILLSVHKTFPGHFKNFVFVSIGEIDSATMKGAEEVDRIQKKTEDSLKHYLDLARRLGLAADARSGVGTEAVEQARTICVEIAKDYPRSIFFAGKLIFEEEHWYQRILHNETAYQMQRKLQFEGLNAMVLPIRVISQNPATA